MKGDLEQVTENTKNRKARKEGMRDRVDMEERFQVSSPEKFEILCNYMSFL